MIEPNAKKYKDIFEMYKSGQLQIPRFQRKYVWDLEKTAALIDSILKDYPIGSFVFWKTDEALAVIRELGDLKPPIDPPEGKPRYYVLDGQQRLLSIIAAFEGKNINDLDYSNIFVNLNASSDADAPIVTDERPAEGNSIQVKDLIKDTHKKEHLPLEEQKLITKYRDTLVAYLFPIVWLDEERIEVATTVFERMNTGGKALTLFEIMVAKTFEKDRFDLLEKYNKFMKEEEVRDYNSRNDREKFQKIVLQVVSVLIKESYSKENILGLSRKKFIETWPKAIKAIKKTIEYFDKHYGIVAPYLLPYPLLIVLFSYYFYKQQEQGFKPSDDVRRKMQDLFWRIALGKRYNKSSNSRFAQDLVHVKGIMRGGTQEYDWKIPIQPEQIIYEGEFKPLSSYIKALLAILVAQKPRNFHNNRGVNITNQNLKRKGSKNYHHFFPIDHMIRVAPNEKDVDNIVNITIIDAELNRSVGAKAPSVYMEGFAKTNKKIEETMETHLITLGDRQTDPFSIFKGNEEGYKEFQMARAKRISEEIQKRIILTESERSELEAINQRQQALATH